jgi:hypothetical protein
MQVSNLFSRRDFLKLSCYGLIGFFTPPFLRSHNQLSNQQGRVIYNLIEVFDHPSIDGRVVKQYWVDSVIPITEVTIGGIEPDYNRVWYRIGIEGYAHSGGIQPVRTIINQPIVDIPRGGQLAEVTVPYTDARWDAGMKERVAYRFYYETTHWVIGLTFTLDGTPWYRVLDDKWELVLYVPAQHIRLIPETELKTISPNVPPEAKRIEVRTREQVVIAYEWDHPVFMARTATGAEFSNGKFYTPVGRHKTFHKRPSRHMAGGNLARNGYDLPGIPWVSYITESGIAFHGTYWHNDYGLPRSHGCINLTSQAAKWIYRWTLPSVPPNEQAAYDEFATNVDII